MFYEVWSINKRIFFRGLEIRVLLYVDGQTESLMILRSIQLRCDPFY